MLTGTKLKRKKLEYKSDFAKEQFIRAIILNDKHYVQDYIKANGDLNFEVLNFILEDQNLAALLQPHTRPRPLHLSVLLNRKRITAMILQKIFWTQKYKTLTKLIY